MKAIKFIIFIFLAVLLKVSSVRAELRASFELNYDSEVSQLLGEATFELDKEGPYEFNVAGLKLKEFLLDGEVPKYELRGGKLRIQNPRKNTKFIIIFEKELPVKGHLLIQIEENYLPWPTVPVIFDITLRGFPGNRGSILIPSEERERTREVLKFKMYRPINALPPLIIGRLNEYKFELLGREVHYIYTKKIEESELKTLERLLVSDFSKLDEEERSLFLPYERIFLLAHSENTVHPLVISIPSNLKVVEQARLIRKSTFKHSLLYSLGFRNESLIEALSTFFSDYRLSENRTAFRRKILLDRASGETSFFLLFEAMGRAREEEFASIVKDYLLQNLYSNVREESFMKVISNRFGKNFSEYFQPERICPITIKPTAWSRPLGSNDLHQVDLTLTSGDCFRTTHLRLRVQTSQGIAEYSFTWDVKRKTISFKVKGKPLYLQIDPEYEIYRFLYYEEKIPPVEAVLREGGIIYLPRGELYPAYRELIQILLEKGHSLRYGLPRVSELPRDNVVFLDSPPLGFHLDHPKEGFLFYYLPHPEDPTKHLAFVRASSAIELREALKALDRWRSGKIVHLKKGKVVTLQEIKETPGILINLSTTASVVGFRMAELVTPERLISELLPYQVILIGEQHDRYSHHFFQLELIKRIRAQYPKVAIGLEMIQRPFQKYLDEFVEGKISERELLEKTEYFERWGYDWRLYRDIFLFARDNKVKLIALDLPQELTKKVFKSGLQSLTYEEKIQLPELDLHNPLYENYLRKIFSLHHFSNETNFEFFYQAQVLRDEGMAERILEFLRTHPDYKIIVLVGAGHIREGMGIPHSLRRRDFVNFRTILLGDIDNPTPSLSDYWFLPQEVEFEGTPSLGIVIDEKDSGLVIRHVKENSPAKRADLRIGDRLLRADNIPLEKISRLKLILSFKGRGDKIKLLIERDNKVLEKEVILE